LRDAIRIKEMSFHYNEKDCQVTDFWITESGEVYASLTNNGNSININVLHLKNYVKEGVIDLNSHRYHFK